MRSKTQSHIIKKQQVQTTFAIVVEGHQTKKEGLRHRISAKAAYEQNKA
jgi:hypothetical protein